MRLKRGGLYEMLTNPVYRGMIRHKKLIHQGQHEPIVDLSLWDAAQAVLADNGAGHRARANADHPSLLTGLLVDQAGRPMSPSHTCRASKRYRYYHTHPKHLDASPLPAMRVSAGDFEPVVIAHLCAWLHRPDAADTMAATETTNVAAALAASRWAAQLEGAMPSLQRMMLTAVVHQIAVEDGTIVITIDPAGLAAALGLTMVDADGAIAPVIRIDFRIARIGKQMKLVVKPDATAAVFGDTPLIRVIAKAHTARQVWMKSRGKDDAAIALQLGYSRAYLRTLLRVSFLAPDITAMILDGRQPVGVGEHALMRSTHLPIDWVGQRDALGIG